MSRANPTPQRLKILELRMPAGDPAATFAVVAKEPAHDATRRVDDDLVSLRSAELRTPLASIVGFAELLHSGDLSDDQRELYAGILLREGRRLTAQVDNALALQRLETGQRQMQLDPVDLGSLIQRAIVAAGADEHRPIGAQVPEQLPLVSADAEAILEVLANFLSNARKFSPVGGSIRIGARNVGDMVEIYVRDHGAGIEAEALPKLFHKFYRGDSAVRTLAPRSAGLGLAINHRIIEAHGGQVGASSKGPGKGARFQFTLPVSRPRGRSADVLIVEDDAGFASLMKAEFATVPLTTVRAVDAETAEHLLANITPRAMILDLALPGLQGEEFLFRLRARGAARLPIVVLTVKNLTHAEISALETAGALAVLPKEAGAPQAAVALIVEALALDPVAG